MEEKELIKPMILFDSKSIKSKVKSIESLINPDGLSGLERKCRIEEKL
jgi:hypothetical protein